jgi:hypothetical protein
MSRALDDDLSSSNDKKRKLAVLLAIEDAIDTKNRPRAAANGKQNASKPKSKLKSKLVDEEPEKPMVMPDNGEEWKFWFLDITLKMVRQLLINMVFVI